MTVEGLSAAGGSSTSYTNSVGRECAAIDTTCNNDTNGYLANWKALIDNSKLTNAKVGLVFTPRSPANPVDCPNCPWTTARYLKIRAYVSWEEAQNRRRIAFFDTTKINRE